MKENYFDRISSTYRLRAGSVLGFHRSTLSSFYSKSSLKGSVLELGAGDGLLTSLINCSTLSSLTVLDISFNMLLLAHSNSNFTTGIQADCHSLPFSSNSFDSAICSYLIQYCNPSIVFKEVNRVLRPSGTFLLLEVNSLSPQAIIFSNKVVRRLFDRPTYSKFYSTEYLSSILSSSSFKITKSGYLGPIRGSFYLEGVKL